MRGQAAPYGGGSAKRETAAQPVTVVFGPAVSDQITLHDDAAQLVRFVCALATELTAAQFYTLWFDASAGDIKPRLEKRYGALTRTG